MLKGELPQLVFPPHEGGKGGEGRRSRGRRAAERVKSSLEMIRWKIYGLSRVSTYVRTGAVPGTLGRNRKMSTAKGTCSARIA